MLAFEEDIASCLGVLKAGGLILYPTDTIWGIGCDACNEKAVEKVYALKQRPDNRSMIVLVADEGDVLRYTASPDLALFDYLEKIQKPTTVIYEGAIGLAENLVAGDGSVAIRICRDPFCRSLIRRFRKPIVSTSANISGEAFPASFIDISDAIKNGVDYVVRHRQDEQIVTQPSSIIKWNKGEVVIIRP